MGVVDRDAFSKTIQLIMKTALILGTVAVAFVFAEPEAEPKADADPYLLYGGYTASTTQHMQHMPPTATPTPMAMEATSTAGRRGKQRLSPRLTLIHTTCTDSWARTCMDMFILRMATPPVSAPTQPIPLEATWPTAERRGKPILSPRLRLIHGCIMAATLASTTLATTPTQPTPPTQPIPAAT